MTKIKEPEYELVPTGTQQAVCVAEWDLGLQDTGFKDDDGQPNMRYEVALTYELAATKKDGSRFIMEKVYGNSLDKRATLAAHLTSWGKLDFLKANGKDTACLVGQNCFLSIVHEVKGENTWPKIAGVTAIANGMAEIRASKKLTEPYSKMVKDKLEKNKAHLTRSQVESMASSPPASSPDKPYEKGWDEIKN